MAVWSSKLGDWPKASVAQFNPADGRHLLRYLERAEGAVKHHEEWVALGRTRFQWLAPQPPGAAPNPSHAAAPRGEDAVGAKVRVFWPGMCKWYTGKVRPGLGRAGWLGMRCMGGVGSHATPRRCSAAAVDRSRLARMLLHSRMPALPVLPPTPTHCALASPPTHLLPHASPLPPGHRL